MTKKDFEAIAAIISELVYDEHHKITPKSIAHQFAKELSWHNPRFNRTKFIDACLVRESKTCRHGGYFGNSD